jgi:CBS domain-containing protein
MKSPVRSVAPDAGVREAARLLRDSRIGCLPVCEGGRVVGMLTDRDIAWRALAEGRDPASTACREIMSAEVATVRADEALEDAVRAMDRAGVHHLPVLDAGGAPVGILALGDVALHLMLGAAAPQFDAADSMGEMTTGIPEPTLADEVLRLVARDAWR